MTPTLVVVNESVVLAELSTFVADALEATGLSTRELAHQLGVNQSTVSRLMRRKNVRNVEMLERILGQLGYDVKVVVAERSNVG